MHIDAILLIVAIILLLVSFLGFSYKNEPDIIFNHRPNFFIFPIAVILLIAFLIKHFLKNITNSNEERRQYNYVIDIDETHKINIKQGDISLYTGDKEKVILLPANTSFDEKCIKDKNSALGSYFLTNYPGEIERTKKLIVNMAIEKFNLSVEKKYSNIGDTILLSNYDGEKTNILISAVTHDYPNVGIQATAEGIISVVKNAIFICSENRYSSITMPIIGTGHGGIKKEISLTLICLQYFISLYHLQNHHVKELNILIHDPEKQFKNEIDDVVGCIKNIIIRKRRNKK